MSAYQEVVEIRTSGRGFTNVTAKVQEVVTRSGLKTAICTVFIQHTSASLVIQENAGDVTTTGVGSHASLLKTIENLLGVPVMNQGQLPGATNLRPILGI